MPTAQHPTEKKSATFRFVFNDIIYRATCFVMTLQDKLQVDCSVLKALFATYLATLLGLAMNAKTKLVLHNEIFCNLSRNVRKRNPLQVAEDMLHVAISTCNFQ